jgi:hypothetical protein
MLSMMPTSVVVLPAWITRSGWPARLRVHLGIAYKALIRSEREKTETPLHLQRKSVSLFSRSKGSHFDARPIFILAVSFWETNALTIQTKRLHM